MAKRFVEIECYCCGDCPYYNGDKNRCTLGAIDGEAKKPFYSDCPLNWREEDG